MKPDQKQILEKDLMAVTVVEDQAVEIKEIEEDSNIYKR